MEYVNNFEKSKNLKKNIFSKKTKIVFSSIIILLNCFILNSNVKHCNAKNPNEHIFFKTSSEHRTLGINTIKLDSWKNCSFISCPEIKTYLKQATKNSLSEFKWKLNKFIIPNSSFTHISPLVEKISELRKCRINPKVQLEELIPSGIKSYLMENQFPKSCSVKNVIDRTINILKSNGFNYDKYQNGESLRTLVNYFPGLKSLVDDSLPFLKDNGRGFMSVRFFSGKGSPFFKELLCNEFLNGYNVPSNSTKATEILIENACRQMSKIKLLKIFNKKDNIYKLRNHHELNGLLMLNSMSRKKKFYISIKKIRIGAKMWHNNLYFVGFKKDENMGINLKIQKELLIDLEKLSKGILSSKIRKNFSNEIKTKILKRNYSSNLEHFIFFEHSENKNNPGTGLMTSLLNKRIQLFKLAKSGRTITHLGSKKIFYQNKKVISFHEFKKKKSLFSTTPKDRIISSVRKKFKKNYRPWRTIKVDKTFNLHTLSHVPKNFYPKKIHCGKFYHRCFPSNYYFIYKRFQFNNSKDRKINLIKFCKKFDRNSRISKKKLSLTNNIKNFNTKALYTKAKNYNQSMLLTILKHLTNKKRRDGDIEFFNFTKNFCSMKTKDWKTLISFLNKCKPFKNSKLLNLFGITLESGIEIPKSSFESTKFYYKSAELGNHNSLMTLAAYLTRGTGIKKNRMSAFLIFAKTAHEGFSRAGLNIIIILKNGIGIGRDNLRALKLLKSSRNLISKNRKPYKNFKNITKNGFLKTLFSSIRTPNEINIINFFIASFTSSFTSYLGTIMLERAYLIASDINISNNSEKKGSVACRKKLKNLFLENRQQYLFQENSKGLPELIFGEITMLIIKWNVGVTSVRDRILLKKQLKDKSPSSNFFHTIKTTENILSISFYQIIEYSILLLIRTLNLGYDWIGTIIIIIMNIYYAAWTKLLS